MLNHYRCNLKHKHPKVERMPHQCKSNVQTYQIESMFHLRKYVAITVTYDWLDILPKQHVHLNTTCSQTGSSYLASQYLEFIYTRREYYLLPSLENKLCKLKGSKENPSSPNISAGWKQQLKRVRYETEKHKHAKGNDINKYKYCLQTEAQSAI